MKLIEHLEETGQLTAVLNAIDTDDYAGWIVPVIHYSQSVDESAAGHIITILDYFSEVYMK